LEFSRRATIRPPFNIALQECMSANRKHHWRGKGRSRNRSGFPALVRRSVAVKGHDARSSAQSSSNIRRTAGLREDVEL
jgi:hypothetical protein